MRTQTGVLFTAGFLLSALLVAPLAAAENEGQADLDRAIELKLTAESLAEWGTVIDLCQSAINKGLDKENQDFCKQLLSSTLLQRAELIGTRLLQMSPEEIGVQGAVVWRMAIKDIERSVEIDPKQAASQLWLGKLHAMQGGDRKTARKALDQAIRLAGDDRTTKAEALRWRAQIKENLDERLKDLSEAVELAPQNIEILRLRGATHLAAGKADAALADFDAALAIDTDDPGAHEGRGMTLEALKRYDEASESYLRLGKLHAMQGGNRKTARKALDRAIRLAGDDRATKAEALRWRAQIRENLDERLKDLSEAVELAPQNAEFLRLRGATHLATGNADEALADFDAALAIDTDDPAAHEGRGMTLEALKRYDEARENYQRAAQLAPGNAIPLLQQARVSALAGKNEQALADFDAALAIDAKNAVAHEGRGMTLEALKRYDEARESYGLAAELVPGNVIPLLQQARVSALAGKHEQTLEDLARAMDVEPDNLFGLLLKAQTLALIDKAAEGIPEAKRAIDRYPDSDDAVRVWAMVIEKAGKIQSTIKELRQQVEANPDDAIAWLQLGLLYSAQKQSGRAIDAYSAAIKINPREFAYQVRADTFLNHGKQKEAIADYENALKIAPTNSGVLNNLAWVLATSPEAQLRNGDRALELAIRACEVTNYQQAHILSTLAAAYAEKGDFKTAREWSAKSVEIGDDALKDQLRKELASYEKQQPWREKQGMTEEESQQR